MNSPCQPSIQRASRRSDLTWCQSQILELLKVWDLAEGSQRSAVPVQAGITTPNIDIALQPPAALCLLVYQGHNATVSFNGPGGSVWCTKLIQLDGNWFKVNATTPAAGLDTVCSLTTRAGVTWTVYDSGGHVYGQQACAKLNQLTAQ